MLKNFSFASASYLYKIYNKVACENNQGVLSKVSNLR